LRLLLGSAFGLFAWLGLSRFHAFHNETFDLAFYTRMAWGMARGEFWEPILNAHVLGLHISPVLIPLGWLGSLFGTAEVLLIAQALCAALAAWPLARFGARRLGGPGALLGAAALLAYPNLTHVTGAEAHPGTLALLPMAWLIDALDRGEGRALLLSSLGVLACREDLALVTMLAGLLFAFGPREPWAHSSLAKRRRWGLALAAGSLAYFALFVLVLQPLHAPESGSFEAHFGKWGDSLPGAVWTWCSRPDLVLAHLLEPTRASYLPTLLLPLALMPLLRARWLLLAAPALAINLLSDFPGTAKLDSHYLTTALVPLCAAGVDGMARAAIALRRWRPAAGALPLGAVALGLLGGQALASGAPYSLDYDPEARRFDARSEAAARIVRAVPAGVPIQAPDALLPHLAERPRLHRAPPPDRGTPWLILDISHRARFAHQESLLRTIEEPIVRTWLAREDVVLREAAPPYLLLERGGDPREGVGWAARIGREESRRGRPITGCLEVLGARRSAIGVRLELLARGPCGNDLAIRIDAEPRPSRVDLLFDGLISPAHLRSGDLLISEHAMQGPLTQVHVGALRSSGARPDPSDPLSIAIDVLEPE
ncbi:MAG: DUF2079 domain-containing protein, partial [Myxococcales bacterium]|nr:DUF2079 domain-containing protein [Myxococcales bacterium]